MKTTMTSTLALLIAGTLAPAVHADTGSSASDRQIEHNVRVNAARHGVGLSHVFVFSRGGAVTLVGWVPQHEDVAMAGQSAAAVDGVTSVNNQLARGR